VAVVGAFDCCVCNISCELLSLDINVKANLEELLLFVPADEGIKINSVKLIIDNDVLLEG
jgi:hypothetical protein